MKTNREEIILPPPKTKGEMSLEEAIWRRRSVRRFSSAPLPLEAISQILWAGQGISDKYTRFRTAPSAGAIFPCHLYALLPEGVYKYMPDEHKLSLHLRDDLRSPLAEASLYQDFIAEAPLVIVITAELSKTMARYGTRATRYVYMEIGHIGQNIQLQAVALGYDSVCVGAFQDEKVKSLLSLPTPEEPLYIIPVGKKR
ncbi:SagB/ThcOx family dehydrogenase [bacterium]|nr:SagB/ThcOx family dehydrogenase [bacterium]